MICSATLCSDADVSDLSTPEGRLSWARARAYSDARQFADAVGVHPTTYRAYESGQNGFGKHVVKFAAKLKVPVEWLLEGGPTPDTPAPKPEPPEPANDLDMVGIHHLTQFYGLGAAFSDTLADIKATDIEVLKFPKVWIETITWSPPELLMWARVKGDSMLPTIDDGDLVLLDRSQTRIKERDALWAFTVGEQSSIKRLRVKGDRVVILSDNPAVPPDEEMLDHINIVARVIFVGKRK